MISKKNFDNKPMLDRYFLRERGDETFLDVGFFKYLVKLVVAFLNSSSSTKWKTKKKCFLI